MQKTRHVFISLNIMNVVNLCDGGASDKSVVLQLGEVGIKEGKEENIVMVSTGNVHIL